MLQLKEEVNTVDEVKKHILDTSLIVTAVIGSLAFLISLFRWYNYGFHISHVINFLIIACVILMAVIRSRLSINFKAYLLVFLIVLLTFADAINYGLFSSARIYLILIPFVCIVYLPFRRTLLVFVSTIVFYLLIGYLHHHGILAIPPEYDPNHYVLELYPWIINTVHISVGAFIILLVTRRYINSYTNLISDQEVVIKERTEDLESANEELKATNEELFGQREELEDAIENLHQTQKQLIQSEKMASLGILAAGVAHEINNPLNFINGGVVGLENYIGEHLKEHATDLEPLIEGIQVGVKRASEIVTSLNHYSRHDDAPMIPCDIHTIIDNCLVMMSSQLKYKVEIQKIYTDRPYKLICNEGKIHQAMLNILSNAEHAIADKGSIIIATNVEKSKLIITITDTGCGISQENLPRITDPFFTTKDPGKGTGLGLSITYNILQEYNGTLDFESQLGIGTKVVVTLPVTETKKPWTI
ncbi:MAG: GHKL domain-containing protein [Bacteroidales bacterium]|nr:GHKL domain-containing protein [Bacteroidales bacterium]